MNCLNGDKKDSFDLGEAQVTWLAEQLDLARLRNLEAVLFMHTYPSELLNAGAVQEIVRGHRVLLIEMGHTHYNELANDGRVVYAATRSTG